MLAAYCTTKDDSVSCAKLLGTATNNHKSMIFISGNTPSTSDNCGFDTCSFYSGPSDATIMAFGENNESCGSIAYFGGGESCGSIAYFGGGESCGSIASSSSGGFSGGGCSYSC